MKNKVKVMIGNISKNEWNDEIVKYLWLLEKENFEIYVAEQYGKKIGEVLADPIFENKLYSKGIYVQKIEKDKNNELKSKKIPGFNIYNLELDRDRNCVQNTYDMNNQLGKILACALDTNKSTKLNIKKEEKIHSYTNNNKINLYNDPIDDEIVYINDYGNLYLSQKIISLLSDENINFSQIYFFSSGFRYSTSIDNIDKLWRTWEKMNYIEHRNPPKFQPADYENIQKLGIFMDKNKLNKIFYLFFEVKKGLMELLKNSSLYLGFEEKFEKYKLNCQNVDKTYRVNIFLNNLEQKVKIPNFNKDFVNFKKFDFGNDIYFYDDTEKKLFFS